MKFVVSFLSILLLLGITSCMHVTPVVNESKTIAFDGNEQNAGIINFRDDGSLEITTRARDKYNALIEVYGSYLLINTDYGVTPLDNGNYEMTKEACEDWFKMKLKEEKERIDKAK